MAFSLKSLFRPKEDDLAACRLYGAVVEQARLPGFYEDLGVPDSPAGRFSMVALHGFLVMERLSRDAATADLAQSLFDAMFADIDRNLREMGVGDLSVGKKMKALAQHFYGMADAVRAGLQGGQEILEGALSRNIYGEAPADQGSVRALAGYVEAVSRGLGQQATEELSGGRVIFGPLPLEAKDDITG